MSKTALVIDGSSGAHVVRALEEKGYTVVRTAPEASGALTLAARNFDASEMSAAAVSAAEETGGISLLAWCAALAFGGEGSMLLDIDEESWDAADARGARGAFLALKYALPYLVSAEGAGVEIYMPDASGLDPAEAASCAALKAFAEAAKGELEENGVAVSIKYDRGALD